MKDLLHGNGVRFHLKQLAVQMLGHSEAPTDEEEAPMADAVYKVTEVVGT